MQDMKSKFRVSARGTSVFVFHSNPNPSLQCPTLNLCSFRFTQISAERVGVIEVYRSFWSLTGHVKINGRVLEVLVLMGTPAELGKITGAHADLQITGMFLGPEKVQHVGGFDYFDYEIGRKAGLPKHFGGVSGGGVWRVWLFCSPETDEIDWKFNFHGVAFYQLGIGENPTTIRCHGPESVTAVLRTV